MRRIFLDHASATPATPAAMKAFLKASKEAGNPSSPHAEGRAAKALLEEARRVVAHHVAAKPEAIIFTAGATEANGIAIRGHVKALLDAGRAPNAIHLLYVPSAHASVIEAMEALRSEGIATEALVLKDGRIDFNALKKQVRDSTALVSVDVVCGETGTRFDTRGLRHALDLASPERRILIHADASQAPLVESIERTRLGADLITLDASKIGGVRGMGVLVAPITIPLLAVIEGGGQERGIRSGTQTPALAAAFASALEEAANGRSAFTARAARMREEFLATLSKALPSAVVNGTDPAPHIINISLPGVDTEYLAALLDEEGIGVSTRSACETDSSVSRAVLALTGDEALASSTIRVSLGVETTSRDLTSLVFALSRSVQFLERSS